MIKMRIINNRIDGLLLAILFIVFCRAQNVLAEQTNNLASPPLQVVVSLLATKAAGPARFQASIGVFWNVIREAKLYMCPMDNTNTPLFAQRDQQISSYALNGAVCGYNRMLKTCVRLGSITPESVAFWETDEQTPHYFNDGANFPREGVSKRHLQGAMTGRFDGSTSFYKYDRWYEAVAETNRNELWCYPDDPTGR
jgi:hypothetical protein